MFTALIEKLSALPDITVGQSGESVPPPPSLLLYLMVGRSGHFVSPTPHQNSLGHSYVSHPPPLGCPWLKIPRCATHFLGSIRIKLAQIRNFSFLNNFPKWLSHLTVFAAIFGLLNLLFFDLRKSAILHFWPTPNPLYNTSDLQARGFTAAIWTCGCSTRPPSLS